VCIVPGTFGERHPATPGYTPPDGNIFTDTEGRSQFFEAAYFIATDGKILGS
jgi:hypothetical protein